MQGRYHEPSAGLEHTRKLADSRIEVGQVGEREPADDEVELRVVRRNLAQVALDEARLRDVLGRPPQHLGREVDAEHLVPEPHEPARVPPRAAGGVERAAWRYGLEQPPHQGLLEGDDLVAGVVVGLRPGAIRVPNIGLGSQVAACERLIIEHAPHLGKARLGRLVRAVVEMPEQGEALDTDQQFPQPYVTRHAGEARRAPGAGPRPGPRPPRPRTTAARDPPVPLRRTPPRTGGSWPAAPRSATPRHRGTLPA